MIHYLIKKAFNASLLRRLYGNLWILCGLEKYFERLFLKFNTCFSFSTNFIKVGIISTFIEHPYGLWLSAAYSLEFFNIGGIPFELFMQIFLNHLMILSFNKYKIRIVVVIYSYTPTPCTKSHRRINPILYSSRLLNSRNLNGRIF